MPPISPMKPTPPATPGTAQTRALMALLPFLRRYARAATGSQSSGDALVRATLEAALGDPAMLATISASRTGLFRCFSAMWNAAVPPDGALPDARALPSDSQLGRMPSYRRQALLLNQLEEFSLIETAEILDITATEAGTYVAAAQDDISHEPAARVLIIEDEPLIANHLADIVRQGGHQIVANATTAGEARDAYALHHPTLILSDVQLADGSSGIDAVDEILRLGPVAFIFITGFPQKLLTGGGHEPAFLITKPFREDTVRATINQALFFGASMID